MTEALDLIAEARRLQEKAEDERDYWKMRAGKERKRMKALIEIVKRRPMDTPELTDDGVPHRKHMRKVVEEWCSVMTDPYAIHDAEDGYGITHKTATDMFIWRVQDLVKAVIVKDREQRP